jgi:hypothetical protein
MHCHWASDTSLGYGQPYRGLAARKNGSRLCGIVGKATFGGADYFIS